MNRPNLFIVGAPKCGTTAWVEFLSGHPEIFFSPAKEPHFFSEDFPNFRWARTLEEYEKLFAGARRVRVIGEASVQYLYSNTAASKIRTYNPDARILIFLRDQSSFLPSYHNQLLYNMDETVTDFATAWRLAVSGQRRDIPATCREPSFLDYPRVGRFSEQVARYLQLFPRENVKVVRFEEWTRDPRTTYVELIKFLGLADDERTDFPPVHGAKHHRSDVLALITQRPPNWVLASAKFLRRFVGRERLGAAEVLRKVNTRSGYRNSLPPRIRQELYEHFRADNEVLLRLLVV